MGIIEKPDCEMCRLAYDGDEPPCEQCVPPLAIENVLILKIYNLTYQQIGRNNASVFQIIDRYISDFEEQEFCFLMLYSLWSEVSRYSKEIQEQQNQQLIGAKGNHKWLH